LDDLIGHPLLKLKPMGAILTKRHGYHLMMVDAQGAKYSGNRENNQQLEGPLSFKVGEF
jgi:hypothetical protein